MISLTTFLVTVVLGAVLYVLFKNDKKGKLPTGPFALPVLGNLLDLGNAPYKAFDNWAKKYGKMCTISFGMEKVVVLSDTALIKEAFNDPNISARPDMDGFTILSDGPHGVLNSSGQEWVDQRRFTLRHLRDFGFGKNAMEELVMEEITEFISTLKASAGQPISVVRRFNLIVFNALWKIMSGVRHKHDDPKLSKLLDGFSELRNEASGKYLFLAFFAPRVAKMFPELFGWNKLIATLNEQKKFAADAITDHQKNAPEDEARDFIDVYLQEIKATSDKNSSFYKDAGLRSLKAVILDLFNAGSETTSMTLAWAFLYLTKFPEIQKKLQNEIDTVVGKNREVTLADRPNLPYAEATFLEVLRYSTIVPFGVFHAVMKDTDFHGYQFPKGIWVVPNIYYIHFNEELWDSPKTFNPERFLSDDGKKVKRSENLIPFSIGKRACLGETLARDEAFLFITNVFQRFNVRLADDSLNVPIEPKPGPSMDPHPYNICFTDRL